MILPNALRLKLDRRSYRPGETVVARVELDLEGKHVVNKLWWRFEGSAYTLFYHLPGAKTVGGPGPFLGVRGARAYRLDTTTKNSSRLIKVEEGVLAKDRYLAGGIWEFEVRLTLPRLNPEGLKRSGTNLNYWLFVEADIDDALDRKAKAKIPVHGPPVVRTAQAPEAPERRPRASR